MNSKINIGRIFLQIVKYSVGGRLGGDDTATICSQRYSQR
jgi:hypothetical protein